MYKQHHAALFTFTSNILFHLVISNTCKTWITISLRWKTKLLNLLENLNRQKVCSQTGKTRGNKNPNGLVHLSPAQIASAKQIFNNSPLSISPAHQAHQSQVRLSVSPWKVLIDRNLKRTILKVTKDSRQPITMMKVK